MINLVLLKLTENDKRVIFILLAVIILLLVLIAYIGYLVTIVMKWQGKKINNHVTDAVVTGVIKSEDQFKAYARKKNVWLFYHQARLPALLLALTIIFFVIMNLIFGYKDPFSIDVGFGSLLFVWDFSTIITVPEGGVGLLLNWPALVNTPHFVAEAWVSYIFVPLVFITGFWYLFTVQAFIARFLQIKRLGQKIYNESIEHYVAGQGFVNPQPQVQPGPNPNPNTSNENDPLFK